MANPDVQVAALCDVYEPYLHRDRSRVDTRLLAQLGERIPPMGEAFDPRPDTLTDFRRLLERDDIDAVCIATPDHWHAVQGILAMRAGKDIYIEKPLTLTVREGRRLVEVARETGRVAQVGLNRRGSTPYRALAGRMREGVIGPIAVARAYRVSNMAPHGIGRAESSAPPTGLDWDMWLGPSAFRPYQENITPYRFRWWKAYSSQMGNWGVHYLDVIRWMMGEQAPVAVSAHGSHKLVDDDRTIPDTMEAVFEFGSGALATFGVYEASGGNPMREGEVELQGAFGTCYTGERGYRISASRPGQFQEWNRLASDEDVALGETEDNTSLLIRNFLDCVKSREEPLCPLEDGHRSTTFAHLANISLEVGQRLEWDPVAERVTNHEAANALLDTTYRSPWTIS